MTTFTIPVHARIPNGFSFADALQTAEFEASGSVTGAVKVCFVSNGEECVVEDGVVVQSGYDLAVRLAPPKGWAIVRSHCARLAVEGERFTDDPIAWYVREYNRGYEASRRVGRTGQSCAEWDSSHSSAAFDDGYLDQAAGRMKWHLTYCSDHDECGEG